MWKELHDQESSSLVYFEGSATPAGDCHGGGGPARGLCPRRVRPGLLLISQTALATDRQSQNLSWPQDRPTVAWRFWAGPQMSPSVGVLIRGSLGARPIHGGCGAAHQSCSLACAAEALQDRGLLDREFHPGVVRPALIVQRGRSIHYIAHRASNCNRYGPIVTTAASEVIKPLRLHPTNPH